MKRRLLFYFSVASLTLLIWVPVRAQSTTFSYQGSLNTSGTPANGNHDFEFAMFNPGGVQIGFCDGHLEFVGDDIALDVWRAHATRAGNEVIDGESE